MRIAGKVQKAGALLWSDLKGLAKREIDFHRARPRTAILILTYRCDSRCKTCSMWRRDAGGEMEKELELSQWKAIVDKLSNEGIRVFELFGGNILLRKELVMELTRYLFGKGAIIHIPTNQLGLDDEIAEAMVNYVDTVYLSTDGTGNTQDAIRGIDGSERIGRDAVDRLLMKRRAARRQRGRLRIVCNCTVSKYNFDRLERIVEYAESKCFDEVHFEYAGEFRRPTVENSRILDITPEPHYLNEGESILVNREQAVVIKETLRKIRRKYASGPLKITTLNIDSMSLANLYKGSIPHKKCYLERCEVTVDPYGNMVACPFITNFILGNCLEGEFTKVWNGPRHKVFRKAQNSGRLPMCRNCILGVQWNHGIAKSLHRIYLTRFRPAITGT